MASNPDTTRILRGRLSRLGVILFVLGTVVTVASALIWQNENGHSVLNLSPEYKYKRVSEGEAADTSRRFVDPQCVRSARSSRIAEIEASYAKRAAEDKATLEQLNKSLGKNLPPVDLGSQHQIEKLFDSELSDLMADPCTQADCLFEDGGFVHGSREDYPREEAIFSSVRRPAPIPVSCYQEISLHRVLVGLHLDSYLSAWTADHSLAAVGGMIAAVAGAIMAFFLGFAIWLARNTVGRLYKWVMGRSEN